MMNTPSIGRRTRAWPRPGHRSGGNHAAPGACAGPEGSQNRHAGAAVRPVGAQGILEKMGAELAIDDINKAGGIKSLGGAKLKLLRIRHRRFSARKPRTPRSA